MQCLNCGEVHSGRCEPVRCEDCGREFYPDSPSAEACDCPLPDGVKFKLEKVN
jgi:hypothetical protein